MTTDAIGGVWSYTIDLAEALCRRGDRVTVAVFGPEPNEAQRFRTEAIFGLSIIVTGLALDWTARRVADIRAAAASVARLARADIVHLHTPALAAFDDFASPVVVSCHSCVATWWQAVYGSTLPSHLVWQRGLAAEGYLAAHTVLAPSKAFAAATASIYDVLPRVVCNGRPQRATMPSKTGDFVFTSGRLWDLGKNLATLDAAAAMLPWPVLAAGSCAGPNGDTVELRHVRGLGWLSERALAEQLAQAPVFASAALYEPFGLSVLEAAQVGCALVLSDVATFRELWGGAATFVDPMDPAGLAAAITSLMQDPHRRIRQGAAARKRAARYTAEAMASATIAVYEQQLALA